MPVRDASHFSLSAKKKYCDWRRVKIEGEIQYLEKGRERMDYV